MADNTEYKKRIADALLADKSKRLVKRIEVVKKSPALGLRAGL